MVRWSEEEYSRFAKDKARATPSAKEPRIRSTKVELDGYTFQSKREANRWLQLKMELKAGRITKLRRQVPFSLTVNRTHVANYVADFVYERGGAEVVEDTKGFKTEMYRIKRKLMAAIYGIEVVES